MGKQHPSQRPARARCTISQDKISVRSMKPRPQRLCQQGLRNNHLEKWPRHYQPRHTERSAVEDTNNHVYSCWHRTHMARLDSKSLRRSDCRPEAFFKLGDSARISTLQPTCKSCKPLSKTCFQRCYVCQLSRI